MKIAATSTGFSIDDNVEARFGRCPYFLIVDTDTMQYEAIENPNIALGGGAGIQSAQLMSEKGVTTVLTGNCGPNAFNVFGQAGIQVIVGVSGVVRNAVEQFKTGAFSSASGPNVASHFGVNAAPANTPPMGQQTSPFGQGGGMGPSMGGRGMGRGMGRGGGRGRSMGMGAGFGGGAFPAASSPALPSNLGPEEELDALKQQVQMLEQQKRQVNKRIAELEIGRKVVAVVDFEKCTACGICEDVCPVRAIKVEGHAIVDPDMCTGCAICVAQCPQNAIVLTQQKTDK